MGSCQFIPAHCNGDFTTAIGSWIIISPITPTGRIGSGRMINGTHVVIYSTNPEADRAFFRDVLKFPSLDAGHGWLIFTLPPLEAAFHDSENNGKHELYLMCDDIVETLRDLKSKKVKVSEISEQRWGKLASLVLPGGGKIGIYEPTHPSPLKRVLKKLAQDASGWRLDSKLG